MVQRRRWLAGDASAAQEAADNGALRRRAAQGRAACLQAATATTEARLLGWHTEDIFRDLFRGLHDRSAPLLSLALNPGFGTGTSC